LGSTWKGSVDLVHPGQQAHKETFWNRPQIDGKFKALLSMGKDAEKISYKDSACLMNEDEESKEDCSDVEEKVAN